MKTFIIYHKTKGTYYTHYHKSDNIKDALSKFMELNPGIKVFGIMEKL